MWNGDMNDNWWMADVTQATKMKKKLPKRHYTTLKVVPECFHANFETVPIFVLEHSRTSLMEIFWENK